MIGMSGLNRGDEMKPLNEVEHIHKGDFLYPSKYLFPWVVLGLSPNGLAIRDMNTGGVINHINIFKKHEMDTYQVKYITLDGIIKFVKRGNPARLEKGSIIIDREGDLGKGKNREWIVLIPAGNRKYNRERASIVSATNYLLVPINKKSGKPMLESKGVGARSLHRNLKYPTNIEKGSGRGEPLLTLKVVMRKDDGGNLYMIDPTEHKAFRDSLTWNEWEK
jgi:hypothetical protein